MNNEEKVIDIKDILYRTCRQWRSICISGFIFFIGAVLLKFPFLIQYIKKAKSTVLIETIGKYGGLGFVIGITFMAVLIMVFYILTDKIYLVEDLYTEYGINLIGCIPLKVDKKRNRLDHLIEKIFGVKDSEGRHEALIERAIEEIGILVSVQDIEWKETPVIALVSSYSSDITAMFKRQILKKLKREISIVSAGNILQNAKSIRIVEQADLIIIIEKQGFSTLKDYKETCRKLSVWKKDILGVILLDVI